jgi:diguanylate cyclase (GGDEF)-like protein
VNEPLFGPHGDRSRCAIAAINASIVAAPYASGEGYRRGDAPPTVLRLYSEEHRGRRLLEGKLQARPDRLMIEDIKQNPTKMTAHETFRRSIAELDRILIRSRRTAIAEIVTVLAALAAPFLLGKTISRNQLEMISIVDGLLVLILVSRSYELVRHRQTKRILAKQLEIAAKQRVRTDKLYGLSILDPLTGLHNRRFGEQRLAEEIARSERSGDPLAVMVFDLDYFKEINDKFGHAAGDLALKKFSRRVRRAIRACDVPVRVGGDEFLIILPECPRDKVDVILSRIGTLEIEFNREKISVCYSTGRAHYQYSDTAEALLGRADEALYAEKAARPQGLNLLTSAAQPIPTKEAENANLRDWHPLTLDEGN